MTDDDDELPRRGRPVLPPAERVRRERERDRLKKKTRRARLVERTLILTPAQAARSTGTEQQADFAARPPSSPRSWTSCRPARTGPEEDTMNLRPGETDTCWRVYRDVPLGGGRTMGGQRFGIDDQDGVRAAYAAAIVEAQETGAYPGVYRIVQGGRLNGRGTWVHRVQVHIERVGTDIEGLSAIHASLSPDLLRGPAADMGHDMPHYVATGELRMLPEIE